MTITKKNKLLAILLAAMVMFTAMSATAFADTSLECTRMEAGANVSDDGHAADFFTLTLNNVGQVNTSMTVDLYYNDTKLTTTQAAAKRLGQSYDALTVKVIVGGDPLNSSSWTTTVLCSNWTVDMIPNKAVVAIDGNTTTLTELNPFLSDTDSNSVDKQFPQFAIIKDRITISTAQQFADLINRTGDFADGGFYDGKTIILTADIDMTGYSLAATQVAFRATFDGQNHTIKNCAMSKPLFYNFSGTLKNVTFENATLKPTKTYETDGNRLGVLARSTSGTMENVTVKNCTIDSSVDAPGVVGGLAAMTQDNAVVKNCTVSGLTIINANPDYTPGGAFGLLLGNKVSITGLTNNTDYNTFGIDYAVAKINRGETTIYYSSFTQAMKNIKNGDTLIMLDDAELDTSDTGVQIQPSGNTTSYTWFATAKSFTLDMNGHKISFSEATKNFSVEAGKKVFFRPFYFGWGNSVTITGNGTMDFTTNMTTDKSSVYAFCLKQVTDYDPVTLTIENGTYIAEEIVQNYASSSTCLIKGGRFDSSVGYPNTHLLNDYANSFSVTGGTFVGANPMMMDDGNLVATGYTALGSLNSDNVLEYTVMTEEAAQAAAVATVQHNSATNYFTSLAAAVAAAQDGDTVTLLKDTTEGGIQIAEGRFSTGILTIDLNGHTYTIGNPSVGSVGYETSGMHLLKDNTVFIKNGKITSSTAKYLIQNYSYLTLYEVTLDGSNLLQAPDKNNKIPKNYTLSNNNAEILIYHSTIIASPNGYAFDVCEFANYPGVKVAVVGSTIKGLAQIYTKSNLNNDENYDPDDQKILLIANDDLGTDNEYYVQGGNYIQITEENKQNGETVGYFRWIGTDANTHTITLDYEGGVLNNTNDCYRLLATEGNQVDLSKYTPTRSGYTFLGWYWYQEKEVGELTPDAPSVTSITDDPNYNNEYMELVKITAPIGVTSDITVYAQWSQNTGGHSSKTYYNVNFNSNGGSKVATQSVRKNQTAEEPTAPTRDGYTFAGWFTDTKLTNEFKFDTKITKNTNLYAKWTATSANTDDENGNGSGADNSRTIILTLDSCQALVFGETKMNDVPPLAVNGRVMMPTRFVAENLFCTVHWDKATGIIKIKGTHFTTGEEVVITLTVGSNIATVDGETVQLDSTTFVQNNRIYTPLRFIAETLGATVDWNSTTKKITVTLPKTMHTDNLFNTTAE